MRQQWSPDTGDYDKKHPRARYVPLVIPIVVHHGEHGWKAPVRLRELYDAPAEVVHDLLPLLPDFRFILDDLAPQSDDELRARALSALPRLVLWSFKNIRHCRDAIPALRKAIDLVAAAVLAPNGIAARFGALPEAVLAVIRAAEKTQLDRWFQRGIMARSLDDVFGSVP